MHPATWGRVQHIERRYREGERDWGAVAMELVNPALGRENGWPRWPARRAFEYVERVYGFLGEVAERKRGEARR